MADSTLPFLPKWSPNPKTPGPREKLRRNLDEVGGDNQPVVVGLAHRVEATGAGDQVQQPTFGRPEHPHGGEAVEGLDTQRRHAKRHLVAGGIGYIDAVARLEAVEIAKDGGAPDAVEMPIDDCLAGRPRLRAAIQPAGVPDVARDVHQAG